MRGKFARGNAPLRAIVVTVTVTGTDCVPLTVAGLGETVQVVYGMDVVSVHMKLTVPVKTCGERLN